MKPEYKNWIPAGMIWQNGGKALAAFCLAVASGGMDVAGLPLPLRLILIFCCSMAAAFFGRRAWERWTVRRAFSYDDPHSPAWQIVEKMVSYVQLPPRGKCLDIGCGSGALTIAVAKAHPDAVIIGTDPWDPKVTPEYSRELCRRNAGAEGAKHAVFLYGIAQKVEFPDGTFDAVVSNYVYHQVRGMDPVDAILEALRTLKKGGIFVIHDRMTQDRYGSRDAIVQRVLESGCREARLIPTDEGLILPSSASIRALFAGSCLLVGRK